MENFSFRNFLKLIMLSMFMMTSVSCEDHGNLGESCTSDSDCTEGNACTVIVAIDNCAGKTAEQCLEELSEPTNFSIYRERGECNVLQPRSDCDDIIPCGEGEVCVYTGGFSNYTCQAKYEQRIDGFPCHEDGVCASGACTIISEAPGYPVGMCVEQMTSAE